MGRRTPGYRDGGPAAWTPALNAVVFEQDGFALNRGVPDDRSAFYDPRNSFLPAVVARRLGTERIHAHTAQGPS